MTTATSTVQPSNKSRTPKGVIQLHEMEQDHTRFPGGNQDRDGRCGDAVFRQSPGRTIIASRSASTSG